MTKSRIIPPDSATVLAKLENTVFVPALILDTFVNHFTFEKLEYARALLLISTAIMAVTTVLAILFSKCLTANTYLRNIFTYGLAFSNFGFMGNAVVSALFPDMFLEYLLFTLPLWFLLYLWGVPNLLIAKTDGKITLKERLQNLFNPMFVAVLVGVILGLTAMPLPTFVTTVFSTGSSCMSPVAMLLTGMAISQIDVKRTFSQWQIYAVSLIRLVVFPLLFVAASLLIPFDKTVYISALCLLSMPLGLNTIVIPSAYGRDTSVAAGMTVVSHLMSCFSIPLIFTFISV